MRSQTPYIENIDDILKQDHPYLILRNIGVILLKENKALEVMLRTQAEIFLRVPNNSKLNLLKDEEYLELINWDAEKFRKKDYAVIMKVLIPMSGYGERFRKVGYLVPKPLIQIDKYKMIEHVIKMFSDDDEFIFICNEQHLEK